MDEREKHGSPPSIRESRDDQRADESQAWLTALAERLKCQYEVVVNDEGLIVGDRSRSDRVVAVVCRRRVEDGGRWWFFASCGEPIADVERIADTVVAVSGYLAQPRS